MDYKCLHIITSLGHGGAEESVFDTIVQLVKQGIYCDIAIGNELDENMLHKFNLPSQCKVHRLKHLVRKVNIIHDVLAFLELRKLICQEAYTIVQTHTSKAGILGRYAAHNVHTPIIIGTIHGISFPNTAGIMKHVYKYLEKKTAKKTDALICVGEDIKNIYISAGIGQSKQYAVIYTGMNLSSFHEAYNADENTRKQARKLLGVPEDLSTTVVANIGRLETSKNQHALITMLPDILYKAPSTHLCFIGDGPEQKTLKEYAKKLQVEKHITFAGYVQDMWKVMSACDIHAFTSLREGLPRVLVQTSATGIPNISYEVEGANEVIADGKSGFIIPKDNESLFVQKILELIENKDMRKAFGSEGVHIADDRWELEKLGRNTVSLYDTLLKEKGIR